MAQQGQDPSGWVCQRRRAHPRKSMSIFIRSRTIHTAYAYHYVDLLNIFAALRCEQDGSGSKIKNPKAKVRLFAHEGCL